MRLYLERPQLRVDLERRHEHIEDRIDAPTGVHFVSHETRLEQHPKHEARLLQAHRRSKHSGCPCSAPNVAAPGGGSACARPRLRACVRATYRRTNLRKHCDVGGEIALVAPRFQGPHLMVTSCVPKRKAVI